MTRLIPLSLVAGVCALVASNAQAFRPVSEQLKDPKAADVTIVSHVVEPKQLPIEEHLKYVRLPEGFEISIFAKDLINPRMMAVCNKGRVYVTRRSVGDVVMLSDDDGDGMADIQKVVARRPGMHGIAIDGNNMYLVTVNDVYRTKIRGDGSLAPLELLVDDLPDGGQHPNRTIVVGPDKKLYISVGSTCNACDETNPEHATLLQMEPDGSSRSIYASGLRNTIGFGFHPESGLLYGMDHGIDWLGDNEQHEELNQIVKGNQYGWPYIYDDSQYNPQDEPPGSITMKEWAERSVEPVGFYTPHAAPMQMAYYTAEQFPEDYQGDAFIAMRGSWNRRPPSGYEVVRIRFENGKPVGFEAFATGFLVRKIGEWGHYGRLAGLTQARDGALLVSDDTNGVIYRIAYTGKNHGRPQYGHPTNAWGAEVRVEDQPPPSPRGETTMALALDLVAAATEETLSVKSPAFKDGEPIPQLFAAEGAGGENISPPLEWRAGPEGTQSYVVIMEDPDVAENPPFVHWLVYNIPGTVTKLEKGIPPLPELAKPKGALQGVNDRGSIGYFGPMPPVADPAHHYHFQVFALDATLDIKFGATRDELLAAMEGHVLASEEIVGTFDR